MANLFTEIVVAVEVGPWDTPTLHQIAGTITFPNPNTLAIQDFFFDGGGISE